MDAQHWIATKAQHNDCTKHLITTTTEHKDNIQQLIAELPVPVSTLDQSNKHTFKAKLQRPFSKPKLKSLGI
jgi:hypothetical protein